MGLITKTVMMKWNSSNKKYYESLGYLYTKKGDAFEVDIKDLNKNSHYRIEYTCDNCGKILSTSYQNYVKAISRNKKTFCNLCSKKLYSTSHTKDTKLKNGKSFYQWCVENERNDILLCWDYKLNKNTPKDVSYGTNESYWFKCGKNKGHASELKRLSSITVENTFKCNQCNSFYQWCTDNDRQDVVNRWDYELNECSPIDISYKTHKKFWFKCSIHPEHKSELKSIDNFTSGSEGSICCHQCNSIAQWLLDNNMNILLYWDYEKNDKSPWEVNYGSKSKFWFKCSNKKHDSYLVKCNNFTGRGQRCPKCTETAKQSSIEIKTKKHLETMGYNVLTEHGCTIRPINPKTKMPMPYDNEIVLSNGKHLIIEVHGGQHYSSSYYMSMHKCSKEKAEEILKQRKLYDRYKKAYAEHYGYDYLEIPYTAFDKNEIYKQMIDEKIEEILHNTKAS